MNVLRTLASLIPLYIFARPKRTAISVRAGTKKSGPLIIKLNQNKKQQMKTKFYFLSALAGVILLASCGGGVSDATKKGVAAFDSSGSENDGAINVLEGLFFTLLIIVLRKGLVVGSTVSSGRVTPAKKGALIMTLHTQDINFINFI